MKHVFFLFVFFSIYSCNNSGQERCFNSKDSISILYYVTDVETPTRVTKEDIAKYAETVPVEDVIFLENKIFEQIKELIIACHCDSLNQNYDSRIHLKVDTFQMCLPYYDAMINPQDTAYKSLKTIYLIKWKSGFYNTKTKDELKHQKLINEFGIPNDYHFLPHERTKPPFKLVRKVIIISNKTRD